MGSAKDIFVSMACSLGEDGECFVIESCSGVSNHYLYYASPLSLNLYMLEMHQLEDFRTNFVFLRTYLAIALVYMCVCVWNMFLCTHFVSNGLQIMAILEDQRSSTNNDQKAY